MNVASSQRGACWMFSLASRAPIISSILSARAWGSSTAGLGASAPETGETPRNPRGRMKDVRCRIKKTPSTTPSALSLPPGKSLQCVFRFFGQPGSLVAARQFFEQLARLGAARTFEGHDGSQLAQARRSYLVEPEQQFLKLTADFESWSRSQGEADRR